MTFAKLNKICLILASIFIPLTIVATFFQNDYTLMTSMGINPDASNVWVTLIDLIGIGSVALAIAISVFRISEKK
jgi:hypothetical protein